jgi:hypothetical protein
MLSALPPITAATIARHCVRYGPIADMTVGATKLNGARVAICASSFNSLFQMHSYALARLFSDCRTSFHLDRQHVSAVAQRHEGSAKRMAIYSSPHFYKAARAKEFNRLRPADIGPTALGTSSYKDCTELLV